MVGRYVADFAANDPRLVIEVDGGPHDPDNPAESARSNYLEQQGYTVLRFTNLEAMFDIDGVLRRLVEVIAELQKAPLPTLSPEGERA